MVRLQIQLEVDQHRQVKRRARQLGVSVSEVIRRSVDRALEADAPTDADARRHRALGVLGRYTDPDGRGRIGANHDAALAEAYRR